MKLTCPICNNTREVKRRNVADTQVTCKPCSSKVNIEKAREAVVYKFLDSLDRTKLSKWISKYLQTRDDV